MQTPHFGGFLSFWDLSIMDKRLFIFFSHPGKAFDELDAPPESSHSELMSLQGQCTSAQSNLLTSRLLRSLSVTRNDIITPGADPPRA